MQYPWLTDRSGAIEALLGLATTVNEAGSLLRYILREGQLLVHRDGARGLVELGELAVLLSIAFEAQRGVDVEARYCALEELGPESTHYGAAILGAFDTSDDDASWGDKLAARGLVVEPFWEEDAGPLDYTLMLGNSFSRRGSATIPEPPPVDPSWPGPASLPGLLPPSRLRATHARGYARAHQ